MTKEVNKVKISKMSGKLKELQAINTNTLTNNYCQHMHSCKNKKIICTMCYSHYMLNTFRKSCTGAFQHNSNMLSTKILSVDQLPKFSNKNDIIRLHAHGELINVTHMLNLITMVKQNPTKMFSLYTKRLDIINKVFDHMNKPINLILVYSNPIIDKPMITIPNHFDKVFNVLKQKQLEKINCGARNCNTCRLCYKKGGTNIIYEELK